MKIVVIGGSGLIGSRVVSILRERGHEVVAASPKSGVNTITGEGLTEALSGARVVVDVSNSPSFEDRAVLEFFETSGRNLLAAAAAAGVQHLVALSVVGADRLPDSGYMRAKVAQENLIRGASVPYTIVRATQFYEFLGGIAESSAASGEIRLPTAQMQPIAAEEVSAAVAEVALGAPSGGIVEVGGPEKIPMAEAARRVLAAKGDSRPVIDDPQARYFGAVIDDRSLTAGPGARLGAIGLDEWLARLQKAAV